MKKIFLFLIKLYQYTLSSFLGGQCRFYPSCSHYAVECFEKLPTYQAIWYTTIRILKCNPAFKGGVDLVPVKGEGKL